MRPTLQLPGFVIALLSIVYCSTSVAAEPAGTVKTLFGQVIALRASQALPLKVGDTLMTMDKITVPANASIGFTLRDDTLISLGPNSTFVLNNHQFNPVTHEGNVDTSLLKGTMRYVTGLVGRLNPGAIKIDTPNSTIGIRGTELIVEVEGE